MPEHELVGSSVFDRSGYLLGKVVDIQPQPSGNFSMVVKLAGAGYNGDEITISNHSLKDIDTRQKVMHVNFEHQQVMSAVGQGIKLLEERLVVNRKRSKVGEISVRKVVETEMVQVPVRREKLVIEKIGENVPLVEVGLSETHISGDGVAQESFNGAARGTTGPVSSAGNGAESGSAAVSSAVSSAVSVSPRGAQAQVQEQPSAGPRANGEFATLREALTFLDAIARLPEHRCRQIQVTLFLRQISRMEATLHQFESPDTAIQVLSALESALYERCSSVRLDLLLADASMLQTYQNWFTQSRV